MGNNDFTSIQISLASPEQIRSWSYGEVTKPETINYRTLKPERDGLFCERIFGPTKDFKCSCGKYTKARYKGVICERCGVEVARSKVRRERMGHIELAAPVAHIWFVKITPSKIALILGIPPHNLEQIIYFADYIITYVDEEKKQEEIKRIEEWVHKPPVVEVSEEEQSPQSSFEEKLAELDEIRELNLLTITRYQELKKKWGYLFKAGIGAEAILELLKRIDLDELAEQLKQELAGKDSMQAQAKKIKRLHIVEAFRKSGNRPEWMILTVIPVLPPELRPMVQLDGGRFATSDLNDLYRRVINRNNRLRRLLSLSAPEVIIRNEKRMLQEAVDSLIDNGRHGRSVTTSNNHKLKSLSDMLIGKQGRFRQNLLGKRVDYSGRSVIVSGPHLKFHQCGLPRKMALELFKPFVIRRLILQGLADNIIGAKRLIENKSPEAWDTLEEVAKERPVLLNRAPTLHRLSIQAFEPVLIDGNAIQLHPLVCGAFNADFDGDQMAIHVPLSRYAVEEARKAMLSTHNMLKPSSGEPIVTPTLDMVLGLYYLTKIKTGAKGEGKRFSSPEEAKLAYEAGQVDLNAEVEVRISKDRDGSLSALRKTSVGRITFNEALPPEIDFQNQLMDKNSLKQLVADSIRLLGNEATEPILDSLKDLGFEYVTKSGITIAVSDIEVPKAKEAIIKSAEQKVAEVEEQYQWGLMSKNERSSRLVKIWIQATENITQNLEENLDRSGSIYMMANSGAKGNISQIRQMAGMRGLMSDPSGRIIERPIKSCFREGLTVFEYFISTHGARKGLADTALRTADSGYLTRRLINIAQEVIIEDSDCGTTKGIWVSQPPRGESLLPPLKEEIIGRFAAARILHPETGEIIVEHNQEIDEKKAEEIIEAGIKRVFVRSPLGCQLQHGICQHCYGISPATGKLVSLKEAVGIIAAETIGEPGTQLTLRTFHTGGVIGSDITTGLPRVEEIFEARTPKGKGIISEIDGIVEITDKEEEREIKVVNSESYSDEYPLPPGYEIAVSEGELVKVGAVLATRQIVEEARDGNQQLATSDQQPTDIVARVSGNVKITGETQVAILYKENVEQAYTVPYTATVLVKNGERVKAGERLTEGPLRLQDILHVMGHEAVERYITDEVQKVYRSQGVNINSKHIEVIIRQMLNKVHIDLPGDAEDKYPKSFHGDLVDRSTYEKVSAEILAEGGEPATAQPVILGTTKSALGTDSFLAAASFQETLKILADAAVNGRIDRLKGLKENVIIGRLIPARCQISLGEKVEPVKEIRATVETTTEEIAEAVMESSHQPLPLEEMELVG